MAWSAKVVKAVKNFSEEFGATKVHLAGGNARRLAPGVFSALACRVEIDGNQAPLHGAAKLFYG